MQLQFPAGLNGLLFRSPFQLPMLMSVSLECGAIDLAEMTFFSSNSIENNMFNTSSKNETPFKKYKRRLIENHMRIMCVTEKLLN